MAMRSATCHGQSLVWTQHVLVARAMRAITVTLIVIDISASAPITYDLYKIHIGASNADNYRQ